MHPYSLRAWTGQAMAKKSPADAASASDHENPNPSTFSTGLPTRRRYSDVVQGQISLMTKGSQLLANKPSDEGSPFEDLVASADKGNASDEEPPSPDWILNQWVHNNLNKKQATIYTRQNWSLDSLLETNLAKADKPGDTSGEDSPEPRNKARAADPVAAAEEQLTATQKEQIEQQYQNVARKQLAPISPASCGEGPSNPKGKGADPSNWGNLDLDEEELDLVAQQAALDTIKHKHLTRKGKAVSKASGRVKKTVRHATEDAQESIVAQTLAPQPNQPLPNTRKGDSCPINQIPPDSYIGQTLKNIHRLGTRKQCSGDDQSSSSSSDSSGSSSGPDGSENDDNIDWDNSPVHRHRRSWSKAKCRSKTKCSPKSGLKLIAPKEYNGVADAWAYNRFVTEGTTYVLDGRVPKNRQVFVLSYYLDGIAYDFYTQKVSMNFAEWTLQEFYEGLF